MNPKDETTTEEEKHRYFISEDSVRSSARTQCTMNEHKWQKLSEKEISCSLCFSAIIINQKDMSLYV